MSGRPGSAPVPGRRRTLAAVAASVRCPVCAGPVAVGDEQVSCGRGHRFNIARQGYVSLTSGRGGPGTGDSAAMVLAREAFLGAGHYQPVADALSALAARAFETRAFEARADRGGPGLVLDLAGGTGYYLARVLDALDGRLGACVDLSAPALRRAARAHPRAAALGADAWQRLPLADGSRGAGAERLRAAQPGGDPPGPGPGRHADRRRPWSRPPQREPRRSLGLIGIDERKSARLADAYGDYASTAVTAVRYELRLGHADLTDLVAMGPSARHIGAGRPGGPRGRAARPGPGHRGRGGQELPGLTRRPGNYLLVDVPWQHDVHRSADPRADVLDLSFLLNHTAHVLATRMSSGLRRDRDHAA